MRAMSIKEIMKVGCEGMSAAQKQQEQERRLKVVERINKLGGKIAEAAGEKAKVKSLNRELSRIKGEENVWLKKAAWFMY